MDYAAYLEAFKAELANPTQRRAAGGSGSNPFGRPPMAGGIGGAKQVESTVDPKTPEQKQVLEDLHANGRNVGQMSSEDQINEIFSSLKKVEIPEDEITAIAEEMKGLQFGPPQKEAFFGISKILTEKNVTRLAKTAFLAFTLKKANDLLKEDSSWLVEMTTSLMSK